MIQQFQSKHQNQPYIKTPKSFYQEPVKAMTHDHKVVLRAILALIWPETRL